MTHLDPFLPSHAAAALIELYEAFGDPDHFEKGKDLLKEVLALEESDDRWTF